ncbi:thymidine kinase (plasmid) [Pontibacillus sp. ALD_SL1]|uniref:thymidine kinase n=1 Tax=Pontibacillus sp. ALD_SL1 TaxID=2777185 RepID=UPI001A962D6B|nr:thymidine kinase [Pontibacillus sp. ALD_SL1]QST02599.1 thymidine kinase [Pontibacillus sp. ALD_SL1]
MFQRPLKGIHYGELTVISSGSMFAGKTEGILKHIDSISIEEKNRVATLEKRGEPAIERTIGVFKHGIDDRYDKEAITSHSGRSYPATPTDSVIRIQHEVARHDYRVIVIDEAQFFSDKDKNGKWKIIEAVTKFLSENRYVILGGLSKDFRGEAFGPMGDLMAVADEVHHLKGICAVCGSPSTMTQRLLDGKPAYYEDPIILVGASDAYEPRCRTCHRIEHRSAEKENQQSIKNII